ncbi:hypothetical protein FC40_GL001270 [Ligilactobacillus hayakitensis DSM 18933 = JCM 14209]|uniref:RQC P-site tRNA stabilizing factor n=1 Tax=Ligilactobacillus hayakitensis DSM 18933 = JCM 14209 TaxID=1423755 RepID=A0A0R1X0B3_9LACO|nr:RNA-binding S4 domain-containing protein [Ligilactobacillus hayakitensis]KRM19868.1 hypothetical protein FC40_GL001270 [Ligilactobacillus hayakitensis DSM 18933 = JCM 14209]
MRLDKYLKISRIIKRRSVAKDISDQGRISVNGKVAKSSTNVSIGDELVINFGNKTLTVKVLDIKDTTKKNEAQDLFEVIAEEYKEDFAI